MSPAGLFCTNLKKAVDNSPFSWYNNTRRQGRHRLWGISSAGRALAWHARGHRFDPGILHQKALYFVGSMVLFFLLKPIFGGCIASPAPFSGFCRRFLYNPQTFDFTPFSKRNVFRPFFQQAAASSPSMYGVRSKLKVMLS